MEPITVALVAALASGINSVANTAIKDAYIALKNKLSDTLTAKSEALDALENLEKKPDSTGRQVVLNEELCDAKVEQNDEIKLLLNTLLDKLSQTESGQDALSKYSINAKKIGVVGENVKIKNQTF